MQGSFVPTPCELQLPVIASARRSSFPIIHSLGFVPVSQLENASAHHSSLSIFFSFSQMQIWESGMLANSLGMADGTSSVIVANHDYPRTDPSVPSSHHHILRQQISTL
jgi:hypothetical protein